MFVAAHEWSSLRESCSSSAEPPPWGFSNAHALLRKNFETLENRARGLYQHLTSSSPDQSMRDEGIDYLNATIEGLTSQACDLPQSPDDLIQWMQNSAELARAKYRHYLISRRAGAPRRYFTNRAHALHFLRSVSPTKLVDGAWLYGLLEHAHNPRFTGLVKTYAEELGEGVADKNHVLLYRKLLARYGLDVVENLNDDLFIQGAIQLALGWNAARFLPEVIGFNLGYEQLPLHLLITAYELNELGLDPYYFTLHITVDNENSGHARHAVQAVQSALPRSGSIEGVDAANGFWKRVRQGYQLSNAGISTTQVIGRFDIEEEVVCILSNKSGAGCGAHSDYCRVGGRSVNDWLTQPERIPDFLTALQQAGWVKHGAPPKQSRFWNLLQGERAEMFGVFSPYELQVIHDWIRGPASADGMAYNEVTEVTEVIEATQIIEAGVPQAKRRPSFRATARLNALKSATAIAGKKEKCEAFQKDDSDDLLDPDLQLLKAQLAASVSPRQVQQCLLQAMSPGNHWTPAGLYATRVFCALLFCRTDRQSISV